MAEVNETPNKKDVTQGLLLRGSVFVHLDPRSDEVEVPTWLRDEAQLVLQVGLDMPIPIPDLRVDDLGISATLSFQRAPHFCFLPWASVYALVGDKGRGMVWPEDMPAELMREMAHEIAEAEFGEDAHGDDGFDDDFDDEDDQMDMPSGVRPSAAARPLRLVPTEPPAEVAGGGQAVARQLELSTERSSHLRLIK